MNRMFDTFFPNSRFANNHDNAPGTVTVTENQSFAGGGVVQGAYGAPQSVTAHGGEVIGYPDQLIDYEAMADAVADGVDKSSGSKLIVVKLADGTTLARALYDPLQRETERRGGG